MKLFAVTTYEVENAGYTATIGSFATCAVFAENKDEAEKKVKKEISAHIHTVDEVDQSAPLETIMSCFRIKFIR